LEQEKAWMTLVYLSLAVVVIATTIGWTVLLYRQHQGRLASHQQHQQLMALRAELRAVSSAAMGVGQRLITVEKKLNAAIEKQQHLEVSGSNLLPMLSGPVSAEQLVERYGFSEVEARLISRLVDTEAEYND
jgi:hypothetical protein